MPLLNRKIILDTLIKHETIMLSEFGNDQNMGFKPNMVHMQLLLDELEQESFIQKLSGAVSCTYSITNKGIEEGERLNSA